MTALTTPDDTGRVPTAPIRDARTAPRRSLLRHEIWPLYVRALRVTLRIPSAVIPPLLIPVFFLVVNTAALEGVVQLPVFEGANYVSFFLPVALVMTVASAGSGSGLALVGDMGGGYFDKLLLAPIRHTSVLVSRLLVDGTRAAVQAFLILGVGLALGGEITSGLGGALLLVALAFAFGLAYAGIGITIALRTGSTEATQTSFVLFFPLVFLAPTFVPMEFLAGWLQGVAAANPVTYVIEGLRSLTTGGIVWSELGRAFLATAVIGAVTLTSAFRALATRTNG